MMQRDHTLPRDVRFNAPHAHNAIHLRMIGEDPRPPEAVRTTAGNAIRAWLDYGLAGAARDDPGVLGPEWLGRRVWHRTVAVAIDLRRYHPSASLCERVSLVARTRNGSARDRARAGYEGRHRSQARRSARRGVRALP